MECQSVFHPYSNIETPHKLACLPWDQCTTTNNMVRLKSVECIMASGPLADETAKFDDVKWNHPENMWTLKLIWMNSCFFLFHNGLLKWRVNMQRSPYTHYFVVFSSAWSLLMKKCLVYMAIWWPKMLM